MASTRSPTGPDAPMRRVSTRIRACVSLAVRSRELYAAAVCALVLFIVSATLVSVRHFEIMRQHLGGESGNIAIALVSGRGFSDPFEQHTGPTAWMPPSLPILLASLYSIFHTPAQVGTVFWYLSIALLAATGGVIYAMAKEYAQALPASLAVGLFLAWVCLFNFYFIVLTHDVAVITFLLALVAWQMHRVLKGGQLRVLRWGLLGGVSLLTSPATALAWGFSSVVLAKTRVCRWRKTVAAIGISMALAAPWMLRNATVFHQFIPVKANLFCDLYVANYVDDDGVWDYRSMYVHPYLSAHEKAIYAELGERAYVASYKHRFLRNLQANPKRFMRNVWRRALAVTTKYIPSYTEADGQLERRCKRFFHPAVFVAALLAQLLGGPSQPMKRLLGVVWLAFTLPYVLIGLHIRHVLPASCILVLMAFLGLDALAARLRVPSMSPARRQNLRTPETSPGLLATPDRPATVPSVPHAAANGH